MAQNEIQDGMKAYASTITGPAGRPPSQRRAKHQPTEKQIADLNQFMTNHKNALAKRLNTMVEVINQLETLSPKDAEHQQLETLAMLQAAVDALSPPNPKKKFNKKSVTKEGTYSR